MMLAKPLLAVLRVTQTALVEAEQRDGWTVAESALLGGHRLSIGPRNSP